MTRSEAERQAEEAHRLAEVAHRLIPDRRDPERFHLERDEIERGLRRLARRLEREAA
ncbi:MAG: hypothetical protein ACREFP_03145 [Acetobacteraceae bacterium]